MSLLVKSWRHFDQKLEAKKWSPSCRNPFISTSSKKLRFPGEILMLRDTFWDTELRRSYLKKGSDFFLLKVGDFFPQSCWFLEPKLAIFWSQLWFKSGPRFIHDVEINGFWSPGCWWSLIWAPVFLHHFGTFCAGGCRLTEPLFNFLCEFSVKILVHYVLQKNAESWKTSFSTIEGHK